MDKVATTRDLEWAVSHKRDAAELLAEARLELVLAQADLAAALVAHNALYRDREEARAHARLEVQNQDVDWRKTASQLWSLSDWLDDQMYHDPWYYRANDRVYYAEKAVEYARQYSREADSELYELLQAFRAGLVVDEGLQDPALDYDNSSYDGCCCEMCRPYLYDFDDDDYFFEGDLPDDEWDAEEALALTTARKKRSTQKKKYYKRLRQGLAESA
ncbi:MAG: hypothetical protein SGJ27_09855 [Candidatus Melainabacteria bacterium]|nr:hypothetical protein [Candidatus Melainabacteria bacterium]